MQKRTRYAIVAGIFLLVALTAGGMFMVSKKRVHEEGLVDPKIVSGLEHTSHSSADLSHLDHSILAPTNSWISGAVLQKNPKPVYPLPLALQLNDNGAAFSLPTVTSSPNAVIAPFVPAFSFTIAGVNGYKLTRYDGVSADFTYGNDGVLTIAEGSPFMWYTAKRAQKITLGDTFSQAHVDSNVAQLVTGDTKAIVAVNRENSLGATTVQLKAKQTAMFGIVPSGMQDSDITSALTHAITNVTTTHEAKGSSQETRLTYHTVADSTPIVGALPYETKQTDGIPKGTLSSLYGPIVLRQSNTIRLEAPAIKASYSLPLATLSSSQREKLSTDLKSEESNIPLNATTSYDAGKQLYRAANLLEIAFQLNNKAAESTIHDQLTPVLEHWLKEGFYYDDRIHGIAPKVDNFGAQDFNDHHFHYGYFIYAASILAAHDAAFLKNYRPYVDLLAADIASPTSSTLFPALRVYDAYAGHSWASGLAPFSDGNNQESGSEATSAWNAVTLWGNITHDNTLSQVGSWLLANESKTAQDIWLSPPSNPSYQAPLVDINWGGKRVYSTWFSAAPAAKLAIQLIPLNPSQQASLTTNPRIRQLVESSISNNNFNVALGDYILIYSSLYDKTAALQNSDKQKETYIDSADSRTYMQAWIMSAR